MNELPDYGGSPLIYVNHPRIADEEARLYITKPELQGGHGKPNIELEAVIEIGADRLRLVFEGPRALRAYRRTGLRVSVSSRTDDALDALTEFCRGNKDAGPHIGRLTEAVCTTFAELYGIDELRCLINGVTFDIQNLKLMLTRATTNAVQELEKNISQEAQKTYPDADGAEAGAR